LEIACSTITFGMLPLAEALSRIANLGFRSTEIGVVGQFCPHLDAASADRETAQDVARLLDAAGLGLTALNAVPWLYVDDRDDPAQLLDVTNRLLDVAAELRCGLILNAGLRAADNDAAMRRSADALRSAVAKGADLGVDVSVEAPHQGMTAINVAEARRLIEIVGDERLSVTYDASHIVAGGDDAAASLDGLGDLIGFVQARDGRGTDFHVTPGDGDFDWDTLLRRLLTTGFSRPVVLELEYGGKLGPDEVTSEVVKAEEFLRTRIDALSHATTAPGNRP
jgi:sugar phosphate isomerase/epimerase